MPSDKDHRDVLFQRVDGFVQVLEYEGYPLNEIIYVMKDYLELCDEFLL